MTETALKRYMVPSGYGVEENPNGLLYKKECVDPILQELTARAEKAEAERDTAWNDAIEAAAQACALMPTAFPASPRMAFEAGLSACESHIRALKKGDQP